MATVSLKTLYHTLIAESVIFLVAGLLFLGNIGHLDYK